ncbi:MAG: rubredoxin [Cyclobacteriaceae bacterium]
MQVKDLIRTFVKGGIISPGDFLKTLLVAEKLGATHVHFGSRQDILFAAQEKSSQVLEDTFQSIGMHYEVNTFTHQNISSSYVAQDILPGKHWLASHVYHYVLDSFDYKPSLRVNIVDPSQGLVPLFTGQINFIASNQENYWYVYLRFKSEQPAPWQMPLLVYTEDLNKIGQAIEEEDFLNSNKTYNEIFTFLTENVKMNTQPVTENLVLPESQFPYYEGINRLSDGKYWLGLYWRDNNYEINILKAIMERCIETEIGKVSLTPWKSFLIKGIFEKDRVGWEKLLGKFGMNLRHSSLELNWHLPALDREALELKFYLVRELDKLDVSTFGLTFTIATSDDITLFSSVVIKKDSTEEGLFDILYSKEFNPNLTDYFTYAKQVPKNVLPSLIVELCRTYYEGMVREGRSSKVRAITDSVQKDLYQCIHCQTVYDSTLGDDLAGVEKDTTFQSLPETYICPTCGGGKSGFRKMKAKGL